MYIIFYLILASFLVEGITQIVQKSVFFGPVRSFFSAREKNIVCAFFSNMLMCPYCTSVWASMFITLCVLVSGFSLVILGNVVVDHFLFFIGAHRFSNLIHDVWDRYLSRHYRKEV